MTNEQLTARFNEIQAKSVQNLKDSIQGTIDVTCVKAQMQPHYAYDLVYRPVALHRNTYNDVHGGITGMLSDTLMGYGAAAIIGHYVTTTDLSVSYLARMSGDVFHLHIEYNHIGRRLINASCRFMDPETGNICAAAQGTFFILGKLEGPFACDAQFEEDQ